MAERSSTKKKSSSKRAPYSKATDDERVRRNWNKARGLFERREYSVAIIRCATCVELAVNFAIRQELVIERELPLPFVDNLLKMANGLRNKYQSLYLPITEDSEDYRALKALWKDPIDKINMQRNAIAHSGEFRSKATAESVMCNTYAVLTQIMDRYEHQCKLTPFPPDAE